MPHEHEGFDIPPPEGWVEGELMPGPPVDPNAPKPKWYTLTMGPIPDSKKSQYDVVN
jgi:hypothetical protein